MSPALLSLYMVLATLLVLATGIPIAFGLAVVSTVFFLAIEGIGRMPLIAEQFFNGLQDFGIVTIPMFLLMGIAVAASPAGKDLYSALDRWLNRVPGGLVISNLGACSIFAALCGSSPATCAAIGKMGIPEMRKRGYSDELASGTICAGGTLGILIPPSITMIIYGIATGTSIGKLFIAGIIPGLMLTAMFMGWAWFYSRYLSKGKRLIKTKKYTFKEKLEGLPKILPFLLLVIGVLYVLYGGIATPNEASAVGALISIILVAVVYKIYSPKALWGILNEGMKESVMLMMIIAASFLYSFILSNLYVTQTLAQEMVNMSSNKWLLMLYINIFLLIAGCFLPPVAIILMTAPVLYPIITNAGFDPIWFGVILTINMEIGLITPPMGLNLFVIQGIAPDIPLRKILLGSLPFVILMIVGMILLCIFPEIATWLPKTVMK
ncbi:MAG: TRAP transporter large permease [Candidatus Fonsibacter sp.]|jgi:tripartite ATP-independent transporter DctM subunit